MFPAWAVFKVKPPASGSSVIANLPTNSTVKTIGVPMVKSAIKRIPGVRTAYSTFHAIRNIPNPFLSFVPAGHFYSPIPDPEYVHQHRAEIFDQDPESIPGIDLAASNQIELVKSLAAYYDEMPFPDQQQPGSRYYFDNTFFGHGSSIVLYSIMRHFRPKRIVEVGSGFSSAAMLDVNDRFFDGNIQFTFIEPFPDRLLSLLSQEDQQKQKVVQEIVQDVPRSVFSELESNDILFIDSSHVAKIGSDVVLLLTEILPTLANGVIVHIHDMFWPFEYPENWIREGRAWNELYFVKAFLQFNNSFEILLFNSYLGIQQKELMQECLPRFVPDGGSSLWLRKCA